MAQRLSFTTSDGDLALLAWEPDLPGEPAAQTILSATDESLRGPSGALPTGMASPTWSPDGSRLAVSVIYAPQANQAGATLVLAGADGGEPRILHPGAPGLGTMIAPGIPHYVTWSPAGDQLTLLTQTPAGMTLLLIDAEPRGEPQTLAAGAPLFSVWSAGGRALLIHRGPDLMLMQREAAPEMEMLARNLGAFQVPAWSPAGDRFALIRRRGGSASLNLMDVQGREIALGPFPGRFGSLAWSPSGDTLAYSALRTNEPPRFDGLMLDRLDGSQPERLLDDDLLAYFWSPDGKQLAYLTPNLTGRQINWNVLDLESRRAMRFGRFYPSPELGVMMNFFEQYSVSHRLWSPAGDGLLLSGRIALNGSPPEFGDNRLYAQPARFGIPAQNLTTGGHASWAPG